MLKQALIIFLDRRCDLNSMDSCTASFLFYVRTEAESLGTTAGVLALVASVLEFRFLRMISTVEQFAAHKIRFADRAFERD